MIIVDQALERRETDGNPIRIGMIGAGFMAKGMAVNLLAPLPGMRLSAIANRNAERAEEVYRCAGAEHVRRVGSVGELEDAVRSGTCAVTDDAILLCRAENLDVIVEVTGDVEFGARVALEAFENRKHLVVSNAEMGATLGPVLRHYADRAGVVFTDTDGDEPGVAMNLIRTIRGWGLRPVVAGNFKGMLDRYRTPETQKSFAGRHGLDPIKATSFADGTKLSMESAILANAAGFRVARKGMLGPAAGHVREAVDLFPEELWSEQGIVDYLLGAAPNTGAFVLGHGTNPIAARYLDYLKMGPGPLYAFYTPYHLPHLQIASSIARAVLFEDATLTPAGKPFCEVITVAKRDCSAGEILDGIGGFLSYGMIENADDCRRSGFLPMGVSAGCRLTRNVRKDEPVTYQMVEIPPDRVMDRLRREQDALFGTETFLDRIDERSLNHGR